MPTVEKLSITLPHELAQMVREKVGSGIYSSNSEVIREGLRLLHDQDMLKSQKLKALRETVNHSIDDDRLSVGADEVFERLKARHQQHLKNDR